MRRSTRLLKNFNYQKKIKKHYYLADNNAFSIIALHGRVHI